MGSYFAFHALPRADFGEEAERSKSGHSPDIKSPHCDLCDKLGIYRDDLDAYEQGAKRVSANLLLRIAKLLDVRPDYFFQDYTAEELSACLEPSL